MKYIQLLILTSILSLSALALSAQKIAYIDSQQLLIEHPEIAQADATVKTYSDQLIAAGQKKVEAFENNYKAYLTEVESKTLSPVQMQAKEEKLAQEQRSIQQYEVEIQQKIAAKREEAYSPILDKVKLTIEAIGKEDGYTMIFDSSGGSLLYAEASQNLLTKVKSRLGI